MALSSIGKELSNRPDLPTPLPFPPPAVTIDRTMHFGEFLAEKISGTSTSIQSRGILEQWFNRMNIESGSYQAVESRREPNMLVPPRENWEIVLLPLLDSVTASCLRFGDPLAPVPSRTKPCLHAPFTTNACQPNSTFFSLHRSARRWRTFCVHVLCSWTTSWTLWAHPGPSITGPLGLCVALLIALLYEPI